MTTNGETYKKVVVITGCSSGIGLELALQLPSYSDNSSENADNRDKPISFLVVGTVRKLDAENQAQQALAEAGCDVQVVDVTDESTVKNLRDYVEKRYGRCDVVVNNAGYGVPGSLEAMSVETARHVFDVNVWGVMRMVQAFVPLMRSQEPRPHPGGFVLTVSSLSGFIGQPFMDIYTASKHAVDGMLESFRYAVASDNVKVSVVNPGSTTSSFGTRFVDEGVASGAGEGDKRAKTRSEEIAMLWASELKRRNSHGTGHPVEECVREIVAVIVRDCDKDVRNGELVPFRNGTSDFGRDVMEQVLVQSAGNVGIYSERMKVAQAFENLWAREKEEQQKQ